MSTPIRLCPQCHTPLAPNGSFCRNCGTSYFEPIMTQPTQFTSTPSPFIADPSSPEPIQQVAFPSFDAIYPNQYTATADASPGQSDAWSPLAPPETVTPVPQPRKGPNVW